MNEYPKKRKRKTLHPSRYSDSSGISRIADGFNGIFLIIVTVFVL